MSDLSINRTSSNNRSLITWTPTLAQEMDGPQTSTWETAGWSNGNPFNATWQPDQIGFQNGIMTIRLDNAGCPQSCDGRPYASGEYRTRPENFGYGYYEVRMRPAAGNGLVSSFFIYTGEYGKFSHHEIDFEFLGKDTTRVQTNFYVEGRGNHEIMVDLGFDASREFHNYGLKWAPGSLTWYVDGNAVRTETTATANGLPYRPGRIMVNFWPGTGVDGWLMPFTYTGQPLSAQYDWVRYSTLEAAERAANRSAAPAQAAAAPRHPLLTYPDPLIGTSQYDQLSRLDPLSVEDRVPLEQMEAVVKAIAGRPASQVVNEDLEWSTLDELHQYYPELGQIMTLDRQSEQQFYWYFFDGRTYWENAISLLAVYLQSCMNDNRQDKLPEIVTLIGQFRARIGQQQAFDRTAIGALDYAPSAYRLAALDLIEAEVRAQVQGQDIDFYLEGINRALEGIATMTELQYDEFYPSRPDYFSIIKGIISLGSLQQQLGVLTQDEKYFLAADQLFSSIADLRNFDPDTILGNPVGIDLDLSQLYIDPLLTQTENVQLCNRDDVGVLTISAKPEDIYRALYFNLERGYIRPAEVNRTAVSIFHYLKGIAQIKQAGLFASWPRLKDAHEVVDNLARVEQGVAELKYAAKATGRDKNLYFYSEAALIEGTLLLTLADRINFYPEDPTIWPRLMELPGLAENLIAGKGKQGQTKALTQTALDYYFGATPREFSYLTAWEVVKRLEVLVRMASYVYNAPKGKVADADAEIRYAEQYLDLFTEISANKQTAEYLTLEFKYLLAVLYLAGRVDKDRQGNYIYVTQHIGAGDYRKTVYPGPALRLIGEVEAGISALPSATRTYYETYLALKKVTALIQFSQMAAPTEEVAIVRGLIGRATGRDLSGVPVTTLKRLALDYSVSVLKQIEQQTAPALPPYLWHNLTVKLPTVLGDRAEALKILAVVGIFLRDSITPAYPNSAKVLETEYQALVAAVNRGDQAASLRALADLQGGLTVLDANSRAFARSYSEVLAWDMHSLRAELYDNLATLYTIKRQSHELYQYAQSAYMESVQSTSLYDQEDRIYYIYKATNSPPDPNLSMLQPAHDQIFGR
jgi:endo-1,3-1,4-beta-glycanase ExoK